MITDTYISPAAAEARCRRVLAKDLRLHKAPPQDYRSLGAYYATDSSNHIKRGWMSLQHMAEDLGVLHLTCFGREVISE